MKKILCTLIVLAAFTATSQAQLLNWGVRGGAGIARYADNLSGSSTPVLAANVGAFITFGFTNSQSVMADNFCLQTGLNIIRRGTRFEDVLESGLNMSIRNGYYNTWYAQIPILATIRYELPIRQPGHRMLISVGPAVSYGLFGTAYDRKISRGMPQRSWNYEVTEDAFKTLDRLDVNALIGVGYEYEDLSVMLQFDYGFLSTHSSVDALSAADNQNTTDKVNFGNNWALLLTVGYQFPVR